MVQYDQARRMVILDDDIVYKYPGVYPEGSDMDERLSKWRESERIDKGKRGSHQISGDLVDHGILRRDSDFARPATPSKHMDKDVAFRVFDFPFLADLDYKVRWCRCYLDFLELPYDRDLIQATNLGDGATRWCYADEIDKDDAKSGLKSPLEFIEMISAPYCGAWSAARCLRHFQRMDALINSDPSEDLVLFGIIREAFYFGQTWAEGDFIQNSGADAIRGSGSIRSSSDGGKAKGVANKDNRDAILAYMDEKRRENKSRSRAAQLAFDKGLGTSAEANRKLYTKYRS